MKRPYIRWQVKDLMSRGHWWTVPGICKALGFSEMTVRDAIYELQDSGALDKRYRTERINDGFEYKLNVSRQLMMSRPWTPEGLRRLRV